MGGTLVRKSTNPVWTEEIFPRRLSREAGTLRLTQNHALNTDLIKDGELVQALWGMILVPHLSIRTPERQVQRGVCWRRGSLAGKPVS